MQLTELSLICVFTVRGASIGAFFPSRQTIFLCASRPVRKSSSPPKSYIFPPPKIKKNPEEWGGRTFTPEGRVGLDAVQQFYSRGKKRRRRSSPKQVRLSSRWFNIFFFLLYSELFKESEFLVTENRQAPGLCRRTDLNLKWRWFWEKETSEGFSPIVCSSRLRLHLADKTPSSLSRTPPPQHPPLLNTLSFDGAETRLAAGHGNCSPPSQRALKETQSWRQLGGKKAFCIRTVKVARWGFMLVFYRTNWTEEKSKHVYKRKEE